MSTQSTSTSTGSPESLIPTEEIPETHPTEPEYSATPELTGERTESWRQAWIHAIRYGSVMQFSAPDPWNDRPDPGPLPP